MGTILGQIFCTFHKDGCILGRNFLYILVKWVHFSGKNVCTLGRRFVPEPSITSKIHREPPPPPPPPRAIYCLFLFCLCILHQSCLTITAGTVNCPILGGLGSNLHLLWRELGSLTCLRVTLLRTRNLHL